MENKQDVTWLMCSEAASLGWDGGREQQQIRMNGRAMNNEFGLYYKIRGLGEVLSKGGTKSNLSLSTTILLLCGGFW